MNSIDESTRCEALALAVTHGKEVLNIKDIKSIRETCTTLKSVIENGAFVTDLSIVIEDTRRKNFKALAASPLLRSIQHVHLSYHLQDDMSDSRIPRYVNQMLPTLKKISEKLITLELTSTLSPDFFSFGPRFLQKNIEFPSLKMLHLYPIQSRILEACAPSLYAMPQLDNLSLMCKPNDVDAGLDIADIDVLAQAPFIGNLTSLRFSLAIDSDDIEDIDDVLVESLAGLFGRSKNLKQLELTKAPTLSFLTSGASVENLAALRIQKSFFDLMDYSSLSSLEYVSVEESRCRKRALRALCGGGGAASGSAASSHLPLLKVLSFSQVDISIEHLGDPVDELMHRELWQCLGNLCLPSLEKIVFSMCACGTQADFYRIGRSAANLPRLKEFCVEDPVENAHAYYWQQLFQEEIAADIYQTFFASSLVPQLETLTIASEITPDLVFDLLVENAHRMENIKYIQIELTTWQQYFKFIEAGRAGHWPNLQVLCVKSGIAEPQPLIDGRPQVGHSFQEFKNLWPNVDLRIFFPGDYVVWQQEFEISERSSSDEDGDDV
jgi:hypothetical protein